MHITITPDRNQSNPADVPFIYYINVIKKYQTTNLQKNKDYTHGNDLSNSLSTKYKGLNYSPLAIGF